ncbi:carboxypeptidase regulatory-like domain-containing protein [Thalassomonas viridans]|uniref:Carboxypeptidase regulatory-like domain-containing protein n=1 Tax=Thalassomonas viridans TaxID=137584 RepID=A0AAE9YY89_9GAMM|nr:DUF6795 domain-containing protein [Thalassomonas viridans]WDE02752.1 carboxypeptidase regulatory-like domain-containing protein [Thalassomonas viridans]
MFGLLFKYTIDLCPEIRGRMTYKGKPITNLEVSRSLTYSDEDEEVDTTITDNDGFFSFPKAQMKSRLPASIFHEPVIRQVLVLNYQDKNYLVWHFTQKQIKPHLAIVNILKQLDVELTNSEIYHDFENIEEPGKLHTAVGICRWENDFKDTQP